MYILLHNEGNEFVTFKDEEDIQEQIDGDLSSFWVNNSKCYVLGNEMKFRCKVRSPEFKFVKKVK